MVIDSYMNWVQSMCNNMIAVGMSVYNKDCHIALKKAVDSILCQSYNKFEIFIEVDGPVSDEIHNTLLAFQGNKHVNINFNNENLGLATRMNQVITTACHRGEFDFFARMDADDISHPDRFKKQIFFFKNHKDIDVVGSDVLEFNDFDDGRFYKKMDGKHSDLINNIIQRCPFNHPTVMMKMSVFDSARYNEALMNTQDYYLWVDLAAAGHKFANINEALLEFRVNKSFHTRRGLKKAVNDVKSRIHAMKTLEVISIRNIAHTVMLFFLRIAPASVKKIAYQRLR